MTALEAERMRRGLPSYARKPRRATWMRLPRPQGQSGHLGRMERGRLRTLISRMVVDDPRTTNRAIVEAFGAACGVYVTIATVRQHRLAMGLPAAPMGNLSKVRR